MKKTRCQLVRCKNLRRISDKASEIICYNGARAVLPNSAIFICPTIDGYFVAEWILKKRADEGIDLQLSNVFGWYDPAKGIVESERHTVRIVPTAVCPIIPDTKDLERDAYPF